jgi:uncharacterized membrane protein YhaH (DUF805 family)
MKRIYDVLFSGRIGRLAYLYGTFYYSLVVVVPCILIAVAYGLLLTRFDHDASKVVYDRPVVGLAFIVYACLATASFSLSARRLHDVDRPTIICLLAIVPFVNIPFTAYLLLTPGMDHDNSYGAPDASHGFWDVTRIDLLRQPKEDPDV